MKNLIHMTRNLENRSQQDYLRIIGLENIMTKEKAWTSSFRKFYKKTALTFSNKKEKWRWK